MTAHRALVFLFLVHTSTMKRGVTIGAFDWCLNHLSARLTDIIGTQNITFLLD